MKVVLKAVMQTENLSNQGLVMTKEVLDNEKKIGHFLFENNSGIQNM